MIVVSFNNPVVQAVYQEVKEGEDFPPPSYLVVTAARTRAIASNFWKRFRSWIIPSKLTKLCCINAHYKALENLDALGLAARTGV